jgi:aldehyde dehydrogenase (NAD+)
MPGRERGKYLYRIARLIQEKARELAVLESMDGGKTIKESRDVDLPLVAAHFFYYAGWADKLQYAFPGRTPRPLGVAAQIIPWNFPLLMAAWKLAPALACGNTCVLKPAETTSITAMHLAEIFQQAELPGGVVNIVTGARATGQALVDHGDVNKIAFTGSTAVGKMLTQAVAGTKKKLTLELGGKAANIVFEDAPLDQAVEGIISGIFFNQGTSAAPARVCSCRKACSRRSSASCAIASRHCASAIRSTRTPTSARSTRACSSTRFASWSTAACSKAPSWSSRGSSCRRKALVSAELLHRRDCLPPHRAGGNLRPVLSVMTFRTPDEAVERANNTLYGLSAGIWTDKGSKIFKMASKLRAGVVWANTFNKFDPTSPFGGYKESGFGREGGLHGLMPYLELN